MTSAAHLKAIHTVRRRAGLRDDEFRALLQKETGKASSKELTDGAAERFLTVLRGFAPGPTAKPSALRATGHYGPVLQVLWLSAYHLGIVRNKDDAALLKFVERQTGLSHTRFLSDPASAAKAIEALKAWIARTGGVEWPPEREGDEAILARKRAVVRAIAARLVEAGGFTPFVPGNDPWPGDFESYGYKRGLPAAFAYYRGDQWDQLAGYLGGRLRAKLASQRQATETAR